MFRKFAAGTACVSALALVAVGSASAEPTGDAPGTYRALTGMGSDTTMDVMNGLAGVITSDGSSAYRQSGLLFENTPAGSTSIKTSLKPAVGETLKLEVASQSGTVFSAASNTSFVVTFVPRVGDVLTIGGNSYTVSAVTAVYNAGAQAVYGTVTAAANANPTPTVSAAVTGATTENVVVASVVDATARAGATAPVAYNTVTLTAPTQFAHSANAPVLGAVIPAGTKVVASYDAQGGAAQTKANANCLYIANNAGDGKRFEGVTQNGVTYTVSDPFSVTSGNNNVANSTNVNGGRYNGSGSGRSGVGQAHLPANGTWGCLDFARSSASGSIAPLGANQSVNIPFADDALDFGITTTSNFRRLLTLDNIYNIYRCNFTSAGRSMLTAADALDRQPGETVQALAIRKNKLWASVPQFGSGTREYVATMLGYDRTQQISQWPGDTTCLTDTNANGQPIQEHDLRDIDDRGIGVTSIAQAIAQRQASIPGVSDRQGRTVLVAIDTRDVGGVQQTRFGSRSAADKKIWYPTQLTSTFTGGPENGPLGTIGAHRLVYNVIPAFRVNEPLIQKVFVGASSDICANSATILLYGFGTTPSCGSIATIR